MPEWTKERICNGCGLLFRLSDHGSPEAKTAAETLEYGLLDPASLPLVVSKCPRCLAAKPTSKVNEAEAIAAALQIGLEMRSRSRGQLFHYAKRIGMFVAVLSLVAMFLVYIYARLRAGFNPTAGVLLFGILFVAGVGVSAWAFVNAQRDA